MTLPLLDYRQASLSQPHKPVLKVLGMGGGGCNAINRMIELGLGGVEFIAANTDHQALQSSLAPVQIQLGPKLTRGLGAGGKPEVGKAAAEESYKEIMAALEGADMVFLTAGMGGGTGTGSIPVAAKIAHHIGAVTIAIVTTPFWFEMGRRQKNASAGLNNLAPHTDTLIAIPNERLLTLADHSLTMDLAFRMADDVLRQAVQGITELITEPGLINVDFSHVRRLMKAGGGALMSIGFGQGENKAVTAIYEALHHPLLESISIDNAVGVIANFTGGKDLTLVEVSQALILLQSQTGPETEIVMGVTYDTRLEDRAQVILIVTGLGAPSLEDVMPGAEAIARSRSSAGAPGAHHAPLTADRAGASFQTRQPDSANWRADNASRTESGSLFGLELPSAGPTTEPASEEAVPVPMIGMTSRDLQVPAFLRRRTRTGA